MLVFGIAAAPLTPRLLCFLFCTLTLFWLRLALARFIFSVLFLVPVTGGF